MSTTKISPAAAPAIFTPNPSIYALAMPNRLPCQKQVTAEERELTTDWARKKLGRLMDYRYGWVGFPLSYLDPDCDDVTWKERRIGALAHAAKVWGEAEGLIREWAYWWGSGELGTWPSYAWKLPKEATQLSREDLFLETWTSCMDRRAEDDPYTLTTLIQDAFSAGWVPEDPIFSPFDSRRYQKQAANGVDLNQLGERNGLNVHSIFEAYLKVSHGRGYGRR